MEGEYAFTYSKTIKDKIKIAHFISSKPAQRMAGKPLESSTSRINERMAMRVKKQLLLSYLRQKKRFTWIEAEEAAKRIKPKYARYLVVEAIEELVRNGEIRQILIAGEEF
ncbi:MAG: hypothetical protein J7K36_05350 [Archaeoglobaceae archaeon]|nr:hypothetical protein [Archaeoglobaceae archaeon]